ncbi:hypothetical protein CDL15_Pgr016552 [Punica granatum]|uniref:Uncharacterized protein n=1 Tax=Punica granatum TaxID=22663 RepID=A0A218WKM5_PUNGR|nr:hypothetical protein CDL15_Pgr016552 [Punica granatum]
MTTSSDTTPSTTDVTLSVETPFCKSFESKLDALYEVSYLSKDDKISSIDLPLINPYTAFSKQPSFSPIRSIRQLILQSPHRVKEYFQSTRFDQHPIQASEAEQFVTLHIPPEFPRQISQGYTHLQFGAIRHALSYHGRKGLPVVARMALLDTIFLEYQYACIGTIDTTFNVGTVFVTLFPNFNMALSDPRLLTTLKVQLQITGAPQVQDFVVATLHYQMAYRVQNYALDLSLSGSEEALVISVDSMNLLASMFPNRFPEPTL